MIRKNYSALGVEQEMQEQQEGPTVLTGSVAKAMDNESDPEKKVLVGIKAAAKQMDDLTTNVSQWHSDTKKAAEDFTKAKNEFNGLSDSVKLLEQTMGKLRMQFALERRMAHGDPVQRIIQDDEKRTLLNAQIRAVFANANKGYTLPEHFAKALSEGSSPGSLTLQTALARDIYDTLATYGIWNTLGVEPLGTLTTTFPVDTVDPIAQFIDEAGAFTDDTNIAGTSVNAIVKKIGVILYISRELLQDSMYDVTGRVLKKFGRAIGKRADFASFMADGTADATNGSATGIFNFGTVFTAATGNTTMETLEYQDFTGCMLTPDVEVLSRNARWWMHRHILTRCLHVKDGNGRPIFLTALEAPAPSALGSILGYPVTLGNICPTTNTAASKMMAFGDPDAFAVGVRQDVEIASSEHIRFLNDQVAWRGITRMAFKGKLATALAILKTATT